jgi:hypothetical protein
MRSAQPAGILELHPGIGGGCIAKEAVDGLGDDAGVSAVHVEAALVGGDGGVIDADRHRADRRPLVGVDVVAGDLTRRRARRSRHEATEHIDEAPDAGRADLGALERARRQRQPAIGARDASLLAVGEGAARQEHDARRADRDPCRQGDPDPGTTEGASWPAFAGVATRWLVPGAARHRQPRVAGKPRTRTPTERSWSGRRRMSLLMSDWRGPDEPR